jgi:phosphohistidine phosphatase
MKTLFLLRHAKAIKEDPSIPDLKRSLTEEGFAEARLVSEALRQQNLIPDKIISSSAVRAYTTAFIFAAAFEKISSDIELFESLYECTEQDYLDAIHGIDDSLSSCLITGHNNTISMVASRLLGKNSEGLETSGVVVFLSNARSWTEFDTQPCKLIATLNPAMCR